MWWNKQINEITAIDRELTRLHGNLGTGSTEINDNIWSRIEELEATLLEIVRKRNGLEH